MARRLNAAYVSYEEAQRLLPVFEYYAKEGPWEKVRSDARAISGELRDVRNIDYHPLPGQQIYLTSEQYEFLQDVRAELD